MNSWQIIVIVMIFYNYYTLGSNINYELEILDYNKFMTFYNSCIYIENDFKMKTISNIISVSAVTYMFITILIYFDNDLEQSSIIKIFKEIIKNTMIITMCWFLMQFIFNNIRPEFIKYNSKFVLVSKINNINCFKQASGYI